MPVHIINTKIEGAREFNKAMKDYAKLTSRQPAEICNAKAYFIGLRWMNEIKKADKVSIIDKLRAPSKKYSDVETAAILVNWKRGQKGLKGLEGAAMTKAVQQLEKQSTRYTQFLRSGCVPIIKDLNTARRLGDIQFVKANMKGLKQPQGVKAIGKKKGEVIPARPDRPVTFCAITNGAGQEGKQHNQYSKATQIITEGLTPAFKAEVASMNEYVKKKLEAQIRKLNNTNTTH